MRKSSRNYIVSTQMPSAPIAISWNLSHVRAKYPAKKHVREDFLKIIGKALKILSKHKIFIIIQNSGKFELYIFYIPS